MKQISKEEFQNKVNSNSDFVLIDVREPHEHAEFNLGGILLPLSRINQLEISEIKDFKEKEIICYCRSGKRSSEACLLLENLGFNNVSNLIGGVLAW